jgi:hypothetical protein
VGPIGEIFKNYAANFEKIMKKLIDAILRQEITELESVCKSLLPLILIYKDSYLNYIEFKLADATDDDERIMYLLV